MTYDRECRRALLAALGLTVAWTPAALAETAGGMTKDQIIEKALSAAPPQLRADAAVMGPDGTMLKEGSNGYTCMLTPEQPTAGAPMCADAAWVPWANGWVGGADYDPSQVKTMGIAYMLQGDGPGGGASNSDPSAKSKEDVDDWVSEGPHVMLIVPDEALLADITKDPSAGTPYVMWSGTPFAHVMLPVAARPDPSVAEAAEPAASDAAD